MSQDAFDCFDVIGPSAAEDPSPMLKLFFVWKRVLGPTLLMRLLLHCGAIPSQFVPSLLQSPSELGAASPPPAPSRRGGSRAAASVTSATAKLSAKAVEEALLQAHTDWQNWVETIITASTFKYLFTCAVKVCAVLHFASQESLAVVEGAGSTAPNVATSTLVVNRKVIQALFHVCLARLPRCTLPPCFYALHLTELNQVAVEIALESVEPSFSSKGSKSSTAAKTREWYLATVSDLIIDRPVIGLQVTYLDAASSGSLPWIPQAGTDYIRVTDLRILDRGTGQFANMLSQLAAAGGSSTSSTPLPAYSETMFVKMLLILASRLVTPTNASRKAGSTESGNNAMAQSLAYYALVMTHFLPPTEELALLSREAAAFVVHVALITKPLHPEYCRFAGYALTLVQPLERSLPILYGALCVILNGGYPTPQGGLSGVSGNPAKGSGAHHQQGNAVKSQLMLTTASVFLNSMLDGSSIPRRLHGAVWPMCEQFAKVVKLPWKYGSTNTTLGSQIGTSKSGASGSAVIPSASRRFVLGKPAAQPAATKKQKLEARESVSTPVPIHAIAGSKPFTQKRTPTPVPDGRLQDVKKEEPHIAAAADSRQPTLPISVLKGQYSDPVDLWCYFEESAAADWTTSFVQFRKL